MKNNQMIKNEGLYRCLFVSKKVDYYSDSKVEVYDTMSGDSLPIFTFRYTALLALDDLETLIAKYGNRDFSMRLFERLSSVSFSLFKTSTHWLSEVSKLNGLFDIDEVRKDYSNNDKIAAECPICKAMTVIDSKTINLYGSIDYALKFAVANNITDVDSLLYSRYKNGSVSKEDFEYTQVGKLLVESAIYATYKKFGKLLDEYSINVNKPESLLALFNSNRKKTEEFRADLIELGLSKNSSILEISALIDAAIETDRILPNTFSRNNIFKIFVKEFGIATMKKAKPRRGGNKYEKLYDTACKFWKG